MTGNRKPILFVVIALVAGTAGIFAAMSMAGSKGPETKYLMQPVELDSDFVVNLADADGSPHYAKLRVAVQMAPMTKTDRDIFLHGEGGGHGGGGEVGPEIVARDAILKNSVIKATSEFTTEELKGAKGQAALKKAILKEMQAAQAAYEPVKPKASKDDQAGGVAGFLNGIFGSQDKDGKVEEHHSPLEPPFEIERVYLTEFAVQ